MSKLFLAFNGPEQTTAAPALVTPANSPETIQQLYPGTTMEIDIVKWGICFNQSVAATPVRVELIEANVAATVTAYAAADVTNLNQPNDTGTLLTLSTSGSGYTASAEGSITAVRTGDFQQIDPALSPFWYEFTLGRAFRIREGKYGRIRVTGATSYAISTYIVWGEAGD
jgi:hypothetical protein